MSGSVAVESPGFAQRRARAQAALAESDLDAVLLGPSADLKYLAGDAVNTTVAEAFQVADRPALVLLRRDSVRVVAPLLESVDYPAATAGCELVTWADGEDLTEVALRGLPDGSRIGIADDLPYWLVDRIRLSERFYVHSAGPLLHILRGVKTEEELVLMRAASAAADQTYLALQDMELVGRTEAQVAAVIGGLLEQFGCDPGSGEALVAAGPNAASPHHAAGDYVLQPDDVVIIDYGGRVKGYNSDTSRTFVLGQASQELERIHAAVLEANRAAFAAVRPGVAIQDIDATARRVISEAGYAEHFLHRTGHGIGVQVHEHPYVVGGDTTVLRTGMTFTIEPGIYVPDVGGVRIEDVVEVQPDGAASLNTTSRELLRLR